MSDTHLANDAAARTATGELKDQSGQTTQTSTTKDAGSEKDPTQDKTAQEGKKDGDDVSFLNDKEGKTDDKEAKEGKEGAKTGAPEKYEAFKLPEGFEANEEVMTEASGVFKELGLPQEGAQKLVDLYAKQAQAAANAPVEYWQKMQKDWVAEIKADKDLGGKLPEVRSTISKAIDTLGPLAAPFREAMDLTGAGNNPAFVRALYKLAQSLTEGAHVSGGGPSVAGQTEPGKSTRPSAASALYPNLPA